MSEVQVQANHEKLVENYFALIKELRSGQASSIDRLIQLWDDDGTFEFAGSPPVTGLFRGRNAILALYQNRFQANKMPLQLEGEGKKSPAERNAALGIVDTEVHRTKVMDHKLVAGWTTTVGTQDGRGFQVAGSHTFEFKNGKISSLRIVVSPRPGNAPDLRLEGLGVDDIGRLALAAWCVV